MDNFLRVNKNILTYSLIIFLVIPIFGFKLLASILGNILLLLFLIPLLILLIIFTGLNFYKSKLKTCSECGFIDVGFSERCINCGAKIENTIQSGVAEKKPSESTIEVTAEEIK